MIDEIKERVAKGAKFLDAIRPGWAYLVPTDERLRMTDCDACVLGHVYGNYWVVVKCLQLNSSANPEVPNSASGYGFNVELYNPVAESYAEFLAIRKIVLEVPLDIRPLIRIMVLD